MDAISYAPPQEVLERYAHLLVDFALGEGNGIRPGDVVRVIGESEAEPLVDEICKAIWRSGGHVLLHLPAPGSDQSRLSRAFYEIGSDEQISYFPEHYLRALTELMDHELFVLSDGNPQMLAGIDPEKPLALRRTLKPFNEWRDAKEARRQYSWTLAQYATPGLAAEARMSVEEYWRQIIKACFLDHEDPIACWRGVEERIAYFRDRLNALRIQRVHLKGQDLDLWVAIGEKRLWSGGGGVNIPSFEIYTSPDWRGTEGWIRFNEPLYECGSLITGIRLEFRDGVVVRADAEQNVELLRTMIATEGADRLGELSLTDARLSPIDRFMANTLYDENTGGPFGNTHVAIGQSYKDVYDGDPALVSDEEWERLGFNDSAVHTDIVSTTDRTVTAELADGSSRVIYAGGRFTVDDVEL